MAKIALEAAPAQASAEDYIDDERDFVERISAFVHDQARKLVDYATPMRKIDPSLL